jgi:septal ring factor EnvC (AmiA/AmiB activator)
MIITCAECADTFGTVDVARPPIVRQFAWRCKCGAANKVDVRQDATGKRVLTPRPSLQARIDKAANRDGRLAVLTDELEQVRQDIANLDRRRVALEARREAVRAEVMERNVEIDILLAKTGLSEAQLAAFLANLGK